MVCFLCSGVKRVQRDFIDLLWSESQGQEEGEWKSLARHKLAVFEEQLHDGRVEQSHFAAKQTEQSHFVAKQTEQSHFVAKQTGQSC